MKTSKGSNTMTSTEKMITYALSTENKTRNELNLNTCYHWCAEYITSVIKSSLPVLACEVVSNSCTAMQSNMSKSEYWSEPQDSIKAGDIIFYNWEHNYDVNGNIDHVGIVLEVHSDHIVTMEGNTESDKYGCSDSHVLRKTRYFSNLNFNCKYPDYYMRYVDTTPVKDTTPTDTTINDMKQAITDLETALNKLKSLV